MIVRCSIVDHSAIPANLAALETTRCATDLHDRLNVICGLAYRNRTPGPPPIIFYSLTGRGLVRGFAYLSVVNAAQPKENQTMTNILPNGHILYDWWKGGEVLTYLQPEDSVPLDGFAYTYEDDPPGRATVRWYATKEAALDAVDDYDAREQFRYNPDLTYSHQTPEGSIGTLGFGVLSMADLLNDEGAYWTRGLWPNLTTAARLARRGLSPLSEPCALCGEPMHGDWIDSPGMGGLVHEACYSVKAQKNFEANGGKELAERLLRP